ncbi:hypothetical protein N7492_003141 [Penicillium capsulatum]|uniref:Alpha/beta hydrolase fold-3 domain-containing protein n=1 Tax=Penicillium capsulatum TaxID=69766 RepID=A0A9W9IML3_9EURO|nr:hypothetical protein N7492_003141 [Penicillium capsulatum]KAJ6122269.1 hypothetical protein N7512_004734 [Penicillium capsulatum]
MPLQYDPEFRQEAEPLLLQRAGIPKPALHDVATRRAMMAAMTISLPPLPDGIKKLEYLVPTKDGNQVPVYHFRRRGESENEREPAVIHIHGGGFIALSAEQCATLHIKSVSRTGVQILTIDYRLAPEHPYPAPLNDCWAVLQWVHANATQLSIDPGRIAVMGESAGGGIAAALTLLARDYALSPPIAKQILNYPMLDDRTVTNHAGDLAFWDEVDNLTAWTAYVGSDVGTDKIKAYAAPARVEDVSGLPPLYLECPQLDMFVHEGLDYARRFMAANIPTELHVYPGLPHGFEGLGPSGRLAQQAYANRDRAMTSF